MSVTKENEILSAIPNTATAKSVAPQASTELPGKTQPVALEVAVTINGARTLAGSDKREPFSESTKTVLIFAHGAVVRLASAVSPGQLVFLTNEKTKKEVVCQVVKSKNYQNVSGYVELEFTESVAGFWGMRFPVSSSAISPAQLSPAATPPEAPAATPQAATLPKTPVSLSDAPRHSQVLANPAIPVPAHAASGPGTTNAVAISPNVSSSSSVATSPLSASQPSAAAPQNASTTAPAASSLSANVPNPSGNSKPSNILEISRGKSSVSETNVSSPIKSAERSKSFPTTSILDAEEVKIPSWLEPLARNAAAAPAELPSLSTHNSLDDLSDAVEIDDLAVTEITDTPKHLNREQAALPASGYGTHFLADEGSLDEATTRSNKKIMIASIAAAVLLLVGGGAWYTYQQPPAYTPAMNSAPAPSSAAANPASSTPGATQSQASSAAPSGTYTAVSSPSGAASNPDVAASTPVEITNSSAANKRTATVDQAPQSAIPPSGKLGTVNLSAPIARQSAAAESHVQEEALNLESSSPAGLGEGLASGLASNSRQPVAPAAPLPAGGKVKSAKLISSVPPAYPALAKSQRISGDVTIDTLVDAAGHVSNMKVISGPPALQQSAMDALRRWQYEPAQLDGKPAPMHMTVTVQFKLNN